MTKSIEINGKKILIKQKEIEINGEIVTVKSVINKSRQPDQTSIKKIFNSSVSAEKLKKH